MTREEFFRKYLIIAKAVTAGTNVYPSVVLAVAALESRNGESKLTREANNFFGIKAFSSWKGDTYSIDTIEYVRDPLTGKNIQVIENAKFRKYDLPGDSFQDYVDLLTKTDRYKKALTAQNAIDQVAAIKEAGYSTDPNYVVLVGKIMDTLKSWVDSVKKKALSELGEQHYCFWGASMPLIA